MTAQTIRAIRDTDYRDVACGRTVEFPIYTPELKAAVRQGQPVSTADALGLGWSVEAPCPFEGQVEVDWRHGVGTWHCPVCESENEVEL